MSTSTTARGEKRSLSDHKYQDSPKCLLLSLPSNDDSPSSPEYFLPSHLVTDSEDGQKSPDCLLPSQLVGDGYSSGSDDRSYIAEQKAFKVVLTKYEDSLSPEAVQYFTNTEYTQITTELSLHHASLESCLGNILQFTSNHSCNGHDEFTFNGRSMKELVERFDNNPAMRHVEWMKKHDTVDWKTCSLEDRAAAETFFKEAGNINLVEAQQGSTQVCDYALFVNSVLDAYKQGPSGERTQELLKNSLKHLAGVVYHQRFLEAGQLEFPLFVQPSDISAGSPLIEDRYCMVTVRPHGVFIKADQSHTSPVWMLAVQVCGISEPTSHRATNHSPDNQNKVKTPHISKDSSKDFCNTPAHTSRHCCHGIDDRTTLRHPSCHKRLVSGSCAIEKPVKFQADLIGDKHYRAQLRRYVTASLPIRCREDPHCVDRMAGQHVMELFAVAKQNLLYNENVHKGIQKALGMFIVNERVYFSKLLVNKFLVLYLNEGVDHLKKWSTHPPVVSFSNFCLDLTISTHRIALVLFLYETLLPPQS